MKYSIALATLAGLAVAADCPAAGTTNAAGDTGCAPAQQYPGEACALVGGCYVLRGLGLLTSTSSAPPQPTGCPAVGTTNPAGDKGCDPAQQYPGEACALVGGCYVLRGLGLNTSLTPSGTVSSTSSAPSPTQTGCPPPGTTNAAGDYSCNPAHQYPDQVCVLIDGCYFLRGLGLRTTTSGGSIVTRPTGTSKPTTSPTEVPVAGAGRLPVSGLSAVAGVVAAVFYALM